ncbi:MAG: 3-isopropylmalate dehydratase [Promethearchaeota archaeon]
MPRREKRRQKTSSDLPQVPPIEGRAWRFGDNISTDDIISAAHLTSLNLDEIAPYAFETIRPDFAKGVQPNDFVVGGHAFGIGSSRESAPGVLRALGVGAVLAASFARIFFRNAFNLGFPAIEVPALASDPSIIQEGDTLTLKLEQGLLLNHRTQHTFQTTKIPSILLDYLRVGGAIPLLRQKLGKD